MPMLKPNEPPNDFVQLVFTESTPLGMAIYRHKNGVITIIGVNAGSQAETLSIGAMLEPETFHNAFVIGVNGVAWSQENEGEDVYEELRKQERPKSILFMMRKERPPDISLGVGVNKKCNNFVELVFRERLLGVRIMKYKNSDRVIVSDFAEKTEAVTLSEECLLDPEMFVGASIRAVNGRPYANKMDMYEALTCRDRPKSILFELADDHRKSDLLEIAAAARPPLQPSAKNEPSSTLRKSYLRRNASLEKRKQAMYASMSMRSLAVKGSITIDPQLTDSTPLCDIREGTPTNDGDNNDTLSESMQQLSWNLDAMERLNKNNDAETLNKSSNSSNNSSSNTINSSSNINIAVDMSPRTTKARAIVQGFRNFSANRLRTASNTSLDSSEEEEAQFLKQQAYDACIKAICDHLEVFLSETPDVSFEEWIEELHPENAQSRRNLVSGRCIDHRFYAEGGDHRKLWNENLDDRREFVPVRAYQPDDINPDAPINTKLYDRSPPRRNNTDDDDDDDDVERAQEDL